MFSMSLQAMASDEQREYWIKKLNNFDIIGCYAQTELGHGSDVASLKTTAIFDHKNDEFVLHTPSIDATKWWPGELGHTANYALVFARLLIPDEDGQTNDYGIAPFMVQIRDLDTHRHMPGIKTGNLGPKFGYHSKDNGWMTLNHVRIPRSQLMQRITMVDREGSFSLNSDPRVLYSTMLKTRVLIISGGLFAIYYAAVVAVRYSLVRRQFHNISGTKLET